VFELSNTIGSYGHDTAAREDLELVLHKLGIKPIVLENLPADGDSIIEKLEHYLGKRGNVGFACVLLPPDDEGHLAGKPELKKYRARQNVILELRMVLATATNGPARHSTILFTNGQGRFRRSTTKT
jgi:predicted nucleotide-binding protein